jgi:hypothetical protein
MIALFLSYTYFMTQNHLAAAGSLLVGLVFLIFMIKNILRVKKKKKNDN